MDPIVSKRREYGDGSIYQRCEKGCPRLVDGPPHPKTGKPTKARPEHKCQGRWVATIEAGSTAAGKRRRIPVTAKTRAEVVKKVRDKRRAIEAGGVPTQSARTTVKQWATTWLAIKKKTLSPNGYAAAASPIGKWIVPTIGHRRLDVLTPADLRAVEQAQRAAGLKGSTCAATHRTLLNMLRAAIVEGHQVPQRVLLVPGPAMSKSDRLDVPVPEALACLQVAATLPHGTRWAATVLYGARQGECLGLTWESVDFDNHEITLEWQLDALPYNIPYDRSSGFRVPDEHEAIHLVDAWHLVRLKSRAGQRVLPMLPAFEQAMADWKKIAPENPWGLVWPTAQGRPANSKHDLEEWHAIQGAASVVADPADERRVELGPVLVGHPTRAEDKIQRLRTSGPRRHGAGPSLSEINGYWHIHECRNLAATQLGEAGVDPEVIKSLLGHATAAMSGEYRTIHRGPKRDAVEKVAALLPFNPGS